MGNQISQISRDLYTCVVRLIQISTRVCFASDESCIRSHARNLFVYVPGRSSFFGEWGERREGGEGGYMTVALYLDCSCVICDGGELDVLHLDVGRKGGALDSRGPAVS